MTDTGLEGVKFILLIALLAGAMFFYEVVRYGLTEEAQGKGSSTNIRAIMLGATIGTGFFVYAVGLAQNLWFAWGGR